MQRNLISAIEELKFLFRTSGLVIAFNGGVAIDGFLGKITRTHEDIDVDVFGKYKRKDGLMMLKNILSQYNIKFN